MNDGTNAMIEWPYYHEYMVYKEWFDQIEDRALGTLKLAVAKLLKNFDEDQPTKTYSGEG